MERTWYQVPLRKCYECYKEKTTLCISNMVPGTFKGTEEKAVRMTLARAVDRRSETWYQVPLRKCYRDMVPGTFKGTEEKAVRMTQKHGTRYL